MAKIKQNDEVIVTAGRDRGKRGKVLKVRADGKIVVSGINMVKKHQKPNPNMGIPGGIIEKEAALQVSNVAIFNPGTKKGDRVGYKIQENGKKIRIFKSTGEAVKG